MAKLGYARVSTSQQSLDIQIKQLISNGVELHPDFLFTDKASGKNDKRTGLQAMLMKSRQGDEIIVTRLDRLGRNTADMINIIADLDKRGITVTFITEGISTKGSMGKMVVTILSAVAESERTRILERTKEGREMAIEAGVKMGRKPSITDETKQEVLRLIKDGIPKTTIAKNLKISRGSIYKILST